MNPNNVTLVSTDSLEAAWMDTCPGCHVTVSALKHDFSLCSQLQNALHRIRELEKRVAEDLITEGVYFIQCGAFVKIGISTGIHGRIPALQAQNPHDLALIGFIPTNPKTSELRQLERAIHTRFAHLHHRYEWFRCDDELNHWILENTLRPEPFLTAIKHANRHEVDA